MAKAPNQIPVACAAPPFSDEKLFRYREVIDGLGPDRVELKDALDGYLKCVEAWWALPESTRKDVKRWAFVGSGGQKRTMIEQPLEDSHVAELWDVTPWMYELNATTPLLEAIDPVKEKDLRNAAFHLRWFCKELTLDREPITQEQVIAG